jgi:hypothetical protein
MDSVAGAAPAAGAPVITDTAVAQDPPITQEPTAPSPTTPPTKAATASSASPLRSPRQRTPSRIEKEKAEEDPEMAYAKAVSASLHLYKSDNVFGALGGLSLHLCTFLRAVRFLWWQTTVPLELHRFGVVFA